MDADGQPQLSAEERSRLWAHRLHEDSILSDRQNFFLLAHSLLMVAYAQLVIAESSIGAGVVATAAVLLTIVWGYVVRRQRRIVQHVQRRAIRYLEEFRDTWETDRPTGLSSTTVLVSLIPSLVGVVWVVLLVVVFV